MIQVPLNYDGVSPFRVDYIASRLKPTIKVVPYFPLRVSNLAGMCPREVIIGHWLGLACKEIIYPSLIITFGIGSGTHYWAQNSGELFGNELLGVWRCISCGLNSEFGSKPILCDSCGAREGFIYQEIIHTFKIDGKVILTSHKDALIRVGDQVYVLDFKTMKTADYLKLKEPLYEHKIQSATYSLMSFNQTEPVVVNQKFVLLAYIPKEFVSYKAGPPIKVFAIPISDNLIEEVSTKLDAVISGIFMRFGATFPLPQYECSNKRWVLGRSKSCPLSDPCKGLFEDKEAGKRVSCEVAKHYIKVHNGTFKLGKATVYINKGIL
jgi:hypothetical protein